MSDLYDGGDAYDHAIRGHSSRARRDALIILVIILLLAAGPIGFLLTGCAASQHALPPASAGRPAATIQQQGAANVGTGISVEHAMPFGLTALVGMMIWLSHRRSVCRIRNGRQGT